MSERRSEKMIFFCCPCLPFCNNNDDDDDDVNNGRPNIFGAQSSGIIVKTHEQQALISLSYIFGYFASFFSLSLSLALASFLSHQLFNHLSVFLFLFFCFLLSYFFALRVCSPLKYCVAKCIWVDPPVHKKKKRSQISNNNRKIKNTFSFFSLI